MSTKIDLNKYENFVNSVTSEASNNVNSLVHRINALIESTYDKNQNINLSLLLTAAIGLAAECGEFAEIPKKIFFQGKEINDDSIFHMKRELGDIIWYWVNACRALGLDPNEVIAENVKKLEARYPGGKFDPFFSENRQEGDL